jgi:diadenosine tetraphosphate (Ap4A) HIT family hydrolase
VVLARRHVIALGQLKADEAADLGLPLCALTTAMRAVLGCSKTNVALFAEAEGFEHVHFHVVPRSPDMAPGPRGPRVFTQLGGDPAVMYLPR